MAINSREKGKRGERELAKILQSFGYEGARRGVQYNGADGSADVIGVPGLHIECKFVEKLNIDDAMEQSIRDARLGELPVVMHRKNGKPWKVTMLLGDFIEIYKRAEEREDG